MAHRETYGYVYVIENSVNDKLYIGQTIDVDRRKRRHLSNKENGCRAIFNAMNKYGKNNFEFVLIESCYSKEELNQKEIYWIKVLKTISPGGYNLTEGGGSEVPSKETRKKMKENHWLRKNPEAILKLRGRVCSEETKRKLSLNSPYRLLTHCRKGHPFDEENTFYILGKNGNEYRSCRECFRLSSKKSYRKKIGKSDDYFEKRKLKCKNGHPRTSENISYFTAADGRRYKRCKICHRDAERQRKKRKEKNTCPRSF